MGALPRPDLPPGHQRDLRDALHELHHRAGWPSLRSLAAHAGCSHTTVSHAFSSPRLPAWGLVEVLVEGMGGDVETFHRLWLAASSPTEQPSRAAPGIAGRRDELAAVRRHLETGTGLLMVTGEAGIGKTRLVQAATAASDVTVAAGGCLPLSMTLPLLPISDMLRSAHQVEDGQWLKESLAACPAFVAQSVGRLIPELAQNSGDAEPDTAWARQRLFAAVGALVDRLGVARSAAVVVEDLHWSDPSTLDLLEHLLTVDVDVPLVATWRSEDPEVPGANADWWVRVRRLATVTTLDLPPLTRDETREQLALLSGRQPADEVVERVHARAQGRPLFTEQLASPGLDDRELPSLLADLLDARLGHLGGDTWLVARTLGLAERPLDIAVLADACHLSGDDVTSALHGLDRRRLLAPGSGPGVELRHPLMADAIRRRLVAGEAQATHARLATVLGDDDRAEPGEIARHWQEAGDGDRELSWRMHAAVAAGERFAVREELEAWLRVLELWPAGAASSGVPETRLSRVYVRAIACAIAAAEVDVLRGLVDEAMALEMPDVDRVDVLRLAGDVECAIGDAERGLALLDEAIAMHARLPLTPGYVDVLEIRSHNLDGMGRYREAEQDQLRALEIARELDEPARRRRMTAQVAWYRSLDGKYDEALALAHEAWSVPVPGENPVEELKLTLSEVEILLAAGASAEAVIEAAAPGLAAISRWRLDSFLAACLHSYVCEAFLRAGDVTRACSAVEEFSAREINVRRARVHVARASVDVRRGLLAEALARFEAVDALPMNAANKAEDDLLHADAELWAGRVEPAVGRLRAALESVLPNDAARSAAPVAAAYARAQADLLASQEATRQHRSSAASHVSGLVATAATDPFGPRAIGTAAPAHAATWEAELARLAGRANVEAWVTAAAAWDGLHRPHDAAYCRWRGAQVASASGRGSVADRLLKRAARDAPEHVPLSQAIRRTASLSRHRRARDDEPASGSQR